MDRQLVHEYFTEAIRFWEKRRIVYNAVLTAIVVGYYLKNLPRSQTTATLDGMLLLFLLAVLANVAYCAAYLVDVFVQASGFRERWRSGRWVLFAIGMTFAAIVTRFFALAFFSPGGG